MDCRTVVRLMIIIPNNNKFIVICAATERWSFAAVSMISRIIMILLFRCNYTVVLLLYGVDCRYTNHKQSFLV